VPPGQTESVPVELPAGVQSSVERSGAVNVVATTTVDEPAAKRVAGHSRVVEREDMVLTPDPRTPRVRDAGRTLTVSGTAVAVRLACPRERASGCSGRVRILTTRHGLLGLGTFKLRRGQARSARVRLTGAARRMLRGRRSLEAVIELTTRQAGAPPVVKRIQINLRGGRR
jgi:hypothetical protein